MATGGPPPISSKTCSLECTSRDCTLGDNGGRWKTPELEGSLAMQMLVMHREDNHQQPLPVQGQGVEIAGKKNKAEKVSRSTIKCLFESYKRSCQLTDVTDIRDQLLACCETDLRRDLHRYLGTGVDTKSEVELLSEIKKIAVITGQCCLLNVSSTGTRGVLQILSGKDSWLGKCVQIVSDMYCSWL